MLSAALRSASTGSLMPSAGCSPLSAHAFSASTNNITDAEEALDEELLFDDGDEQPGSPAAGRGGADALQQQLMRLRLKHAAGKQQQGGSQVFKLSATLPPTSAWDVPAARAASAGAAPDAAAMARSMPRAISGARLARLGGGGGGGGGDDSDEEPFVPPHLAASMADPTGFMSHSMSTKGAAAIRLRSTTLRQTGFLEGNVGMPCGLLVHAPSP
ncbi:MAG: hypothetical protein J3K34DRAFT_527030 [Monoraphidium minutum]|nr:MAG: hypothetical protein J3K34DRAFT_527030 [Monoraphidium minutum]